MTEEEIQKRAFAMPLTSPAFPLGPYRFVNREYLIITYRTDPERLREIVPEPLAQLSAGADFLQPCGDSQLCLRDAARPQTFNEEASAVGARNRLVGTLHGDHWSAPFGGSTSAGYTS